MNRRAFSGVIASTALLIGGLASSVRPAAAQDAARLERARAALPPTAARTFQRTIQDASGRGLPVDPLIDKALEGSAKGVPPERILAVVKQLADQLGHAQTIIGGKAAPPADITAVADALQRGVPAGAVETLRNQWTPAGGSIAQAVHTLADLLDRGVPAAVALDLLGAWRDRETGPGALRELPGAVERLIREGVLPEQAAAAVASAVRAGRRPEAAGPPPAAAGRGGKSPGPPDGAPQAPGSGKGKGKGQGKGKGKPSGSGPGT